MAKQVRIRRDSTSNLAATTPADSELGHDNTLDELLIGDGTTTGGIPHPNFRSILNNRYISATPGGTGDAITLSLIKAPASYTTYMRVIFKAGASNTGATTININSLGVKNILKVSGGTLVALTSGDIISGGVYEIIYDGTQFQLLTLQNSGITSVSQGDLNTSTGTVSTESATGVSLTLPGGSYGFYPQIKNEDTATAGTAMFVTFHGDGTNALALTTSYVTRIFMRARAATITISAQQLYVTSSPPFDMGDGDAGGFIFLLVDSNGAPVAHYAADVPPWGYNGPTDIRCKHIDPLTGKKFRRVMKKRSLEEIMDGASIQYQLEEITQGIKNADMGLIPHPFGDVPPGHTVVLLDPMDDRLAKMIEYQNAGGGSDIVEALSKRKIYADNEHIAGRKGPQGVMQARLKFKYSG